LAGLVRQAPTAFSFVLCVREAAQAAERQRRSMLIGQHPLNIRRA
jgi:hypothetical protein